MVFILCGGDDPATEEWISAVVVTASHRSRVAEFHGANLVQTLDGRDEGGRRDRPRFDQLKYAEDKYPGTTQ